MVQGQQGVEGKVEWSQRQMEEIEMVVLAVVVVGPRLATKEIDEFLDKNAHFVCVLCASCYDTACIACLASPPKLSLEQA